MYRWKGVAADVFELRFGRCFPCKQWYKRRTVDRDIKQKKIVSKKTCLWNKNMFAYVMNNTKKWVVVTHVV